MRKEKLKEIAKNVGAGPVSAQKNENKLQINKTNTMKKNVGAGLVSARGNRNKLQNNKSNTMQNHVGVACYATQNAITLISLIITIIILLILAGVVLNLVLGNDGIFKLANDSSKNYINEQNKELSNLEELYSQMKVATGDNSKITITIEDLNNIIEKKMKELKLDVSYPIGSIYISTNPTNPKELFGGEWESYAQGRTLIGAGEGTDINSNRVTFNANAIGGEYTHKLTIQEMPSHAHDFEAGGVAMLVSTKQSNPQLPYNQGYNVINNGWWSSNNKDFSGLANTGGDSNHNNIQPYIVTYIWKRIS